MGTTTSAGTPATLELKLFGHFNGAITRNGTALGNVVSADITYANNLDRIKTIRNDGCIDGADPSITALTGSIDVRFADSTLVTQAINGDPCELEFAYAPSTGRRDQYVDGYFGREYDPAMLAGIGYDPDRPATEVMTRAFQILFHRLPGDKPVDLNDLVRDDPEMLDLALGAAVPL